MSAAAADLQQATIREYARQLRLPTLGSQFVNLAEEAAKHNLGPFSIWKRCWAPSWKSGSVMRWRGGSPKRSSPS